MGKVEQRWYSLFIDEWSRRGSLQGINSWKDSGTRSSRRTSDGMVEVKLAHDLLGARSVMIVKKILACFWEDV